MAQCFHCGHDAVAWQADFTFDDFGLEGEGIVQVCHCSNCGADIFYEIPLTDEDTREDAQNEKAAD